MFCSTFIRITCLSMSMMFGFQFLGCTETADKEINKDDFLQSFMPILEKDHVKYENGEFKIFAQKMSKTALGLNVLSQTLLGLVGSLGLYVAGSFTHLPVSERIFYSVFGVFLLCLGGCGTYVAIEEFKTRNSSTPLFLFDKNGLFFNGSQVLSWDDVSGTEAFICNLKFIDKSGEVFIVPVGMNVPIKFENLKKAAEYFVATQKELEQKVG